MDLLGACLEVSKGARRECGHPRLQPYLGSNRTLSQHLSLVEDILNRQPKQNLFGYTSTLAFKQPSTFSQQLNGSVIPAPGCQNNHGTAPEEKNVSRFSVPCAPPGKYAVARRHWPSGEKQPEENREHPVPGAPCDSEHVQFWRLPLHVTYGIPHYRVQ